ncbi:MAG TPA: tRNA (adenosine(37)-N6)-threonylcarbamoyltransferase complex transferase subunit TsaD, partial [Candidatus Acetothermia bacterium]|nr:tRNA (adenosine(37)-N6)-threonylcarbamoyltransferase complex transferase subunit TsaD [Candidatus Acetothermia bacterium]
MKGPPVTLGIETSCDETAVAVLQGETKILSDLIYS